MNGQVVVVGIGGDGWAGLDEARRRAVLGADVLLGGERHLAMLPPEVTAEREP
ncbi:cobalamin biosynthesis bifunctional protein CbiET, partial [Dietzia sp. Cai40]|nr:cobalamin biosynthesis bifunctional protein CbiET [Dietzia sp. Cai40]